MTLQTRKGALQRLNPGPVSAGYLGCNCQGQSGRASHGVEGRHVTPERMLQSNRSALAVSSRK
jgi:hypothetical protein